MQFVFSILSFISLVLADYDVNIERLMGTFACRPECTFNHTEITSTTARFFPRSCFRVCGVLVINENTDLTFDQLKKLFNRMTAFYGGLQFKNTQFTNFSMFSVDAGSNVFDFSCKAYGLTVVNNSQLTTLDFLDTMFLVLDERTEECPFLFENNEKLDLTKTCRREDIKDSFKLKTSGNLVDCGCRGDLLTSDTLFDLQNCTILTNLNMTNITDNYADLHHLSSVRRLRGDIEIRNTNFKNLAFLNSVRKFETKNGMKHEKPAVNIQDNPQMTRFGISTKAVSLEDLLEGPFIINLENLHPDFCLTFEEFLFFLYNNISFKNLDATYCDNETQIYGEPICEFKTMRDLKYGCSYIIGNVMIGPGDEEFVYKLKELEVLFGSLTIRNTTLKNANFLFYLSFIVHLEEDHVMQIMLNQNLEDLYFPYLQNIITKHTSRTAVVHKNPKLVAKKRFIYPISYQTNLALLGDFFESSTTRSYATTCVIFILLLKINF
ncbi:Receptor L-domain domain-containing protein [Caenorhabditis elegans]|uniref:Receptor L-domain domain-containing protein n=1 Tax=Caenorhabditis elegans TaxID=6239 RepID=Q9N4N8_CAEEL|nr:Receptor L-domain domain-containing protein [Caenorhabditis elegans]CCD73704.2 Receptor L-domain domain-containing protein [Caenorhabditis elegans]